MNATDQIHELFEGGLMGMTIGRTENPEAPIFCKAGHQVPTGEQGNYMGIDHQTTGKDVNDAIFKMMKQITEAAKSRKDPAGNGESIIKLPNKRN